MEFVKLILSNLVEYDLDMYYAVNNTPATAKTSSLVEELGQVDYIFSDKTGTLTCNIMEFKMISISGMQYAENPDTQMGCHHDFAKLKVDEKYGLYSANIKDILSVISVCHTVIPEVSKKDPKIIKYQSASPDETALVEGARSIGYEFVSRTPRSICVNIYGKLQEYQILAVNEFNSTRKRMSMVVRGQDGVIKLMIKGADTVIYERLSKSNNPHTQVTSVHLEEYASIGLRTLCLAHRIISKKEYDIWKTKFDEASTALDNRAEKLDRVAELIECNLVLLGATAIEDKLQDGVPDTINILMRAGIKIWVLTGDRQETAINIGYSCRLITSQMEVVICNCTSLKDTQDWMKKALDAAIKKLPGFDEPYMKMNLIQRYLRNVSKSDIGKFDKNYGSKAKPLVLVIDGKTLEYALDSSVSKIFVQLAMLCKAVVCCRVSPLQKALVVRLVRSEIARVVTLAIGDGANDVTMIQAAHVGIGISGQEGLQAARSADFAIAQFRFLRKLLLVHGSWAYSRISKVIVFSFYKNITLYLIQLWFAFYNGFSGQTLFETWSSVSSYNVLWTLLSPLAIGIFDQFLSAEFLTKFPEIYPQGQKDQFYSNRIFFQWFFNAILHSLAIFILWFYVLGDSAGLANGLVADNWVFGEMVYATVLIVVLTKTCLLIDRWVVFSIFAVFGSFVLFFVLFPAVKLF